VDQIAQLFARLEIRDALRRHVDAIPGLRVPPEPRAPPTDAEAAEPPQLDLVVALQGFHDLPEDRVDDVLRVLLAQDGDPDDFFDQIGLGHAWSSTRVPNGASSNRQA